MPEPGSAFGLVMGTAALVTMLVAAAYAIRRRNARLGNRWGLGTARRWLTIHLWVGGAFLLFVLLHTGFSLPNGALGWLLYLLAIWVVATGVFGLFLQQTIPKSLGSALATEVHFARIPELVEEIKERCEAHAAECGEPLLSHFIRDIRPAIASPERDPRYFIDITGRIKSRLGTLEYLRGVLAPEQISSLDELERLLRAKFEIDAHFTLQFALRAWLILHVPPSILLVGAVFLHVFTIAYW